MSKINFFFFHALIDIASILLWPNIYGTLGIFQEVIFAETAFLGTEKQPMFSFN